MTRRINSATTHYQHVDRVHSKRIIELATGACEDVTDVAKMSFADCVSERRALAAVMATMQDELVAAKREGRTGDMILVGNRIEFLNRRQGALKLRHKELHVLRIGEGKRFLKAAMREILSPDQISAIRQRADELEAAASAEITTQ